MSLSSPFVSAAAPVNGQTLVIGLHKLYIKEAPHGATWLITSKQKRELIRCLIKGLDRGWKSLSLMERKAVAEIYRLIKRLPEK